MSRFEPAPAAAGGTGGRLAWYVDRLRCMSPAEVGHRLRGALRDRFEQRRRFELPPGDFSEPLAWWVPQPAGADAARIGRVLDQASRLAGGGFEGAGGDRIALGVPPRWNRDPVTGVELPLRHGPSLPLRGHAAGFDIKHLWEPNRHQHWVPLAQAWALARSMAALGELRLQLASWIDQCPYPRGPNWASPLEAGLRLIAWSLVFQWTGGWRGALFEPVGAGLVERGPAERGPAERGATGCGAVDRTAFGRAVYAHLHFVAGRLSAGSSANNHLIGELAGLLIGTITWPNWPQCARWRATALAGLEREALLQNGADGVNREQASAYHGFVLELLLLAGLADRAAGGVLPVAYWQRLERMAEFLAAITDAGGHRPSIGDADDAIVVWPSLPGRERGAAELLALCAVEFGRGDFKAAALAGSRHWPASDRDGLIEKTRWLLGEAAAERFARLPCAPASAPRGFADGGWYLLGSDLGDSGEVRVLFDAAEIGYLSIAAHGHADALSLSMSVAGQPLLVDPGTYCYNTEPRWRAYFRGTAAHNTVRIDGLDQSVMGGPFMWTRKAHVTEHRADFDGGRQVVCAAHDGYRRLPDPVVHRRSVVLSGRLGEASRAGRADPVVEGPSSRVEIRDEVDCAGPHRVELFWHFAPDCELRRGGGNADWLAIIDGAAIGIVFELPPGFTVEALRGDESRPAGWYSPRFGLRVPCWTLIASGLVDARSRLATCFAPVLRDECRGVADAVPMIHRQER